MQEKIWEQAKATAWNSVWAANLATLPPRRARLAALPRIAYMVGRELADGDLNLRAGSLVYVTLLSLVPMLAVGFAVLKGFGVHTALEHLLYNLLAPLGAEGFEIGQRIIGFVDNVKVGVLGSVGLLVLLWTVISLLQKIEAAFNAVWRVRTVRPMRERFSHYLTVVIVGPLLLFAATGLGATVLGSSTVQELASYDPFGVALLVAGKLLSFALVVAAFTFFYVYIPNTRVRLSSALLGAVVAAVLWQSVSWVFGAFVVGSTRYTAIYSSFAILILFMLLVYSSWLVLLIGAAIAFYDQHRECLGIPAREGRLSNRMRERVALSAALLIAEAHLHGGPPWRLSALAVRLGVPMELLRGLLDAMSERGLLFEAAREGPWLPARDITDIRALDVLRAIREAYEGRLLTPERLQVVDTAERLVGEMEAAAAGVVGTLSLRDLALQARPDAPGATEAVVPATGDQREADVAPDGMAAETLPDTSNAVPIARRLR